MMKRARQFAIKEIVASTPIANQEGLRRELARRGYKVTQATLSRDLKELGVSRVASDNGGKYALLSSAEVQRLRPLVGAEIVSIKANESLIVVQTLPGCASTVGEFIDVQQHPDIIGTVAGDNTLLVIPRIRRKTPAIVQFIKEKLVEG